MTPPHDLVLFDLGDTLIDDPFDAALALLAEAPDREVRDLAPALRSELLATWRQANREVDHPFASHFVQEEVWPLHALLRLRDRGALPPDEVPLRSASLLAVYRRCVREVISCQQQLPTLRAALTALAADGVALGVASNDREYATRAMLRWAELDRDLTWIVTSEGLSMHHPSAEKPSPAFFTAALAATGRTMDAWRTCVYVGNSERNDIAPARALGFRTVRYRSSRAPAVSAVDG
jgi:FMN phosphatase YigB (HAD superfamily)